jgi:hypothetical protein
MRYCGDSGPADCPTDPKDAESAERLWDSVLDWIPKKASFDMRRVLVWTLSTGGYYAARISHTNKDMLRGVVEQGAVCKFLSGRERAEMADGLEYAFS